MAVTPEASNRPLLPLPQAEAPEGQLSFHPAPAQAGPEASGSMAGSGGWENGQFGCKAVTQQKGRVASGN